MPKIKPFVWTYDVGLAYFTDTSFGRYYIMRKLDGKFSIWFGHLDNLIEVSDSIELAKRFAFDDFKRRLEETLGEPVGYDLEIDENC